MGSSLRSLAALSISSELSALATRGLTERRLVGAPEDEGGGCVPCRDGLLIEPSND